MVLRAIDAEYAEFSEVVMMLQVTALVTMQTNNPLQAEQNMLFPFTSACS